MNVRRSLAAPLISVALFLAGCSSLGSAPSPRWEEVQVEIPSDRVLWKVMLLAAEANGYPLTASTDPSTREVLTGWKTNLQPFSRRGTRMRAEMKMEPEGARRWRVSAHVQKQLNKTITDPLNPTRADWEWTDDDVTQAQVLLQHVLSSLPRDLPPAQEAAAGSRGLR